MIIFGIIVYTIIVFFLGYIVAGYALRKDLKKYDIHLQIFDGLFK